MYSSRYIYYIPSHKLTGQMKSYKATTASLRLISMSTKISYFLDIGKAKSIINQKLVNIMQTYEKLTGLYEVRVAQNRVIEAEQKFANAQEKRRESSKALYDIQTKLKNLRSELDNTARGEERYVQLITLEHTILREEKDVLNTFKNNEMEERELFLMLSSAVKDSHEKERAQAQNTKYLSIIGSILGALIGILGSTINNNIKMTELKKFAHDFIAQQGNGAASVPETLSELSKELPVALGKLETVNLSHSAILNHLQELIIALNRVLVESDKRTTKSDSITESLNKHEVILQNILKHLNSQPPYLQSQVSSEVPSVTHFGDRLPNNALVGSLVALIVMPILFKLFGVM